MLEGILQAALTMEQRHQGFSLDEPDDHILRLLHQGKPVAHFSQSRATVEEIRATADHIAESNTN